MLPFHVPFIEDIYSPKICKIQIIPIKKVLIVIYMSLSIEWHTNKRLFILSSGGTIGVNSNTILVFQRSHREYLQYSSYNGSNVRAIHEPSTGSVSLVHKVLIHRICILYCPAVVRHKQVAKIGHKHLGDLPFIGYKNNLGYFLIMESN